MTRHSLQFLHTHKSMSRPAPQSGLPLWVALLLATACMPIGHAANGDLGAGPVLNLPFNQESATAKPAVAIQSLSAATAQSAQVAPAASAAPASETRSPPPQSFDYSANLNSDTFGANLFTGSFARQGATQFNPDYAVASGDSIQTRFWGAFAYDATLTVDPKGNIFLPHVGPVPVAGVRNQDLQRVVNSAVGKIFRANVNSYASLAAAQPVRIFVSGFVNRPGLYSGTSMDGLLHFLDQSGGIDPERGSFLNVQVKRGGQTRATVNLYDFLLQGSMPMMQLADGDVIFVAPRQNTVKVSGLAENTRRFEFNDGTRTVADLVKMAKPRAQATHARVIRNTGTVKNTEYYPLAEAANVTLENGDEIDFTADKKIGTITVRLEGEHQSAQEYVLPYGTKLGELVKQIEFSERSDTASLQLFRQSVKDRQKAMLLASLKNLESAGLTARSGTSDEARLRKEESELILQWVERAKKIEPSGQVFIAQSAGRDELLLQNGDILRVPAKDGLVLVSGEVLFPNAIVFDAPLRIDDYIRRAGGYTQNADASRVIVSHRDGSFDEIGEGNRGFFSDVDTRQTIRPGDEVLVLPRIETKSRQIWKDMTQILFQIAVSAKVIFGL